MRFNLVFTFANFTFLVFFVGLSQAEVDLDSLVGFWAFNEGAGNTVKDLSGKDNHGKAVGDPKWVKGKIGSALEFDGKDDYLEIKNSKSLNVGANDFTLVAWLYPHAPGGGNGIISKGAWCWNGGWILDIGDTGPGAIRLETSAVGGDNGSIITPADTMEVKQWQFVAASVTRNKDSFIYVDGKEVAAKVVKDNDLSQEYPLLMGCLSNCQKAPGGFFNVSISQVALFSGVALAKKDIDNIMEVGMEKIMAVSPASKLSLTWGALKTK